MMRSPGAKQFEMYFSYNQFNVYDAREKTPWCEWTEAHFDQGFTRRGSTVSLRTILQFGHADVTVAVGHYEAGASYERVLAVPFHVRSGLVKIDGPEEHPIERVVAIPQGDYKLYCAQQVTNDDDLHGEERIDLFFEPLERPAEHSEIIVADADLHPPAQLVEDAEIAGQ